MLSGTTRSWGILIPLVVYMNTDRPEEHEQTEIFNSIPDSGEKCSPVATHNPILK